MAARSASSSVSATLARSRLIDPDGLRTKSTAPELEARSVRSTPPCVAGGAQHHDGARRLAHDVAERLQAVELRHVDVERDDVRIERVDLLERVVAVARRADDAELAAIRR